MSEWQKGVRPPFSYYGGKQRMASKIIPLLPKHTVYVEPFAGGAAVFFRKPWPAVTSKSHYREVLNDSDGRIVNFFRVLRDQPDDLARVCSLTPYSRAEYAAADDAAAEPLERARRWSINIDQSFAHRASSGWATGTVSQNWAATWAARAPRLAAAAQRLRGVHIEHDDALAVIRRWDSPQTLFYCDPPYPGTHQGHYGGYSPDDFAALIDALATCRGSFLLSGYDRPEVPSGWDSFRFDTKCSVVPGKRPKRTEVVWRVIRDEGLRPELRKLYDSGKFDCFTGHVGQSR